MIVSYMLGVPLVALLTILVLLVTGWRFDVALLVAALYFLPFVPALFRYSRVLWMHFDRLVDPSQESERYVPRPTPTGARPTILGRHDDADDQEHRPDPTA
jgi:hypothetical protein